MPTVLDWNPTVDPSDLVHRLTDSLAAGSAVVLPGDTGYMVLTSPASPHTPTLLETLTEIADEPPAVLAYGPDDAVAQGFTPPLAARRLMQRGWPDRFSIALPANGATWPENCTASVRERLTSGDVVRFRSPDHPAFEAVYAANLELTLVADTFLPTAADVVQRLGDRVELVISAGERPAGPPPTVVRCDESGWSVVRSGPVREEDLAKLAARLVLFVCTGNTCRSPLVESLARVRLAERLGCRPEELPSRGFWLMSAGTAAYPGGPASPESIEVAAEFGADLTSHRSRPVNPGLLAAADDVIVMTRSHAQALAVRYPGLGPPPRLLCGDDVDLDDPIGAGLDVYRDCARTIHEHLERFIPEWMGS